MDSSSSLLDRTVPVKIGGRPAIHPRRRILEAILYVDRTACAWRMMSRDFPRGTPCTGIFSAGPPTGRQTRSTRRCAQQFGMRPGGTRGPQLGSWIPSRSKEPAPWARGPAAKTQAISPTAASATSWSTPVVCSWSCWSPRRTPTEDGWPQTRRGDGQVGHGRIHGQAPRIVTRMQPLAARNGKMTIFPTTFLENLKSRGPRNHCFWVPDCMTRSNYGRNMILPTRPGAKFACAAVPASSKE